MNDIVESVDVEGEMKLRGESIYNSVINVIELRKRMGMVFQKPNPFPMSIFEIVVYPLRLDGIRHKGRLMESCERGLREAALWDEVKDRLSENGLKLSGGQTTTVVYMRERSYPRQRFFS